MLMLLKVCSAIMIGAAKQFLLKTQSNTQTNRERERVAIERSMTMKGSRGKERMPFLLKESGRRMKRRRNV